MTINQVKTQMLVEPPPQTAASTDDWIPVRCVPVVGRLRMEWIDKYYSPWRKDQHTYKISKNGEKAFDNFFYTTYWKGWIV